MNSGNKGSFDADNEYGLPEAEYSPVSREQPEPPVEPVAFSNSAFHHERTHEEPEKSSSWPMWLALAAILLLAGFFVFYFVFDEPEEKERITTKAAEPPKAVVIEEEPVQPVEEWETPEPEVAEGSVSVISSRTGRYYMIVGSFIDGDMAGDYAQKLAKDGLTAKIIEPTGTRKFYRLSVKDAEGIDELSGELDSVRAKFGENVWIVKY